jgi:hypothetical protein
MARTEDCSLERLDYDSEDAATKTKAVPSQMTPKPHLGPSSKGVSLQYSDILDSDRIMPQVPTLQSSLQSCGLISQHNYEPDPLKVYLQLRRRIVFPFTFG